MSSSASSKTNAVPGIMSAPKSMHRMSTVESGRGNYNTISDKNGQI